MRDVTKIDFKLAHGKIRSLNPGKQKVWYQQDGIDYDSSGTACNPKQVKDHYAGVAADAQKAADDAKEAAAAAQIQADEVLKAAGLAKTARKAG